ncbi:MAG TPA: cation:proton antiporter [Thermoplasmatales archaeon]|jgi:multicomponent Na+:H+ antiporter subunit C|nr:cation:proton antiporter subunit C [Thermoplasmata archaeon]HHO57360.1 cation:proton antiporter [Thermoplasmatales archaeon]
MIWAIYFAIASLLAIGIYGVITKKNLMKIFISISIMETGVNLMLIAIGYIPGGTAPIENGDFTTYVDPLPQALVLTAIVIGVSVLALALVMVINYYEKNKTLEYRRLMKW